MKKIFPVILAGGSGSRLWPLSRTAFPKQLLSLTSSNSMLQDTLQRVMGISLDSYEVLPAIIICNEDHRFLITEQTGEAAATLILEPAGRNTAPAIALAALHILDQQGEHDSYMLVVAADHLVHDQCKFESAVASALEAAEAGFITTFGIRPTQPETGYGYIECGDHITDTGSAHEIKRFVEKPDFATAKRYVETGSFLWNSGMFTLSPKRYIEELQRHRPHMLIAVKDAWSNKSTDLNFIRPNVDAFLRCETESIDYAVMQNASRTAVVPVDFGWSDIGSWDSLWDAAAKDSDENVICGQAFVSNTTRSYIRAERRIVAVIGLQDVIVVETPDAVLVVNKKEAQNVKRAVEYFESKSSRVHHEHVRTFRPWGWYESIDCGERFQVKRIMVKPGGTLSLQLHHHRAEHWIVVSGTAKVTVGRETIILSENESTYIPLGQTHRLENPGKIPLHLIEVQSGSYLGEDDIVRISDNYGRTS